jgi:hypothetical protein
MEARLQDLTRPENIEHFIKVAKLLLMVVAAMGQLELIPV